jgi:imidazolonepropionase-like amidohydrolase
MQDPVPAPEPTPDEEVQEKVVEEVVVVEEETAQEVSPYLAIVDATIHTVTDGTLYRATVLCKNNRILRVGQGVRVPDDARVIDANGMHVYPGLVAVRTSGVVSGSGSRVRDSFDPFAMNVELALSGGLTTVEAGGAVVKLTYGVLDDFLMSTESPWVTMAYSSTSSAGRRQTREALSATRAYLADMRAWELEKEMGESDAVEPSSAGIKDKYIALLKGEALARFHAQTAKDLLSTCDLLEEFPMQSVIFGAREAWTIPARLSRTGTRLVLTPRAKAYADESTNRETGWSIENAAVMWNQGVRFAILPSETWVSMMGIAGRDLLTLPMEAAFAIRGGLTSAAALRAITLEPAALLGMDERIGSISVGKDADLIVCDGDLFDYRSFVQWAVVNGRVAYDKAQSPYLSHIRPRKVPTIQEVVDAIRKESSDDAAIEVIEEVIHETPEEIVE